MRVPLSPSIEQLREKLGPRGLAFVLALLVELLLALLLFFLAPPIVGTEEGSRSLTTFGIEAEGDSEAADAKPEEKREVAERRTAEPPPPKPAEPPPPEPEPPVPPLPSNFVRMTRSEFRAADIAGRVTAPAAPAETAEAGAPARGMPGDSPVVGKAPNGEPLYAAAWYRRPTSAELQPYLSKRATGPGWGLIACRTVAGYRVEDCQQLGEGPRGSGYGGSVRQAAWQFRVRPPRVGGKEMFGTWVSIRITYGQVEGSEEEE